MVLIPGGEFKLGIIPLDSAPSFLFDSTANLNAQPAQNYPVGDFYIDIHEVSYEQFHKFKPQTMYPKRKPKEPIRMANWYEADAYCLWLGKRLPTEFEWEKAGRGVDGRLFTWGNEFHRDYANLGKTVLPGGSVEQDKSPYGVYDMNGNVSEWTSTTYEAYPNSTYQDENYGRGLKVVRGGSFYKRSHGFMQEFVIRPHRNGAPPTMRATDTGFRCAKSR